MFLSNFFICAASLIFLAQGQDNPFIRKMLVIGVQGGLVFGLLFFCLYSSIKSDYGVANAWDIGAFVLLIVWYLVMVILTF